MIWCSHFFMNWNNKALPPGFLTNAVSDGELDFTADADNWGKRPQINPAWLCRSPWPAGNGP